MRARLTGARVASDVSSLMLRLDAEAEADAGFGFRSKHVT